jgi:hypothetical protein
MDPAEGQQFGGLQTTARPYFPGGKGQGKLFADPKPTDEHRWPRGYTPERMHEVRRWGPNVGPLPGEGRFDPKSHQMERGLQEHIARSTTPVSDFSATTVEGHHRSYPLSIRPGTIHPDRPNASGTYGSGGTDSRQGDITLASPVSGRSTGQTLLHELGHHRSHKVENEGAGTVHARLTGKKTPTRRGQEEAFADDNMMERFRPDPRDVRKGIDTRPDASYEHERSFKGQGGKVAYEAYLKHRKTLSPTEKTAGLMRGAMGISDQRKKQQERQPKPDTGGGFAHEGGLFGVGPHRQVHGSMTGLEAHVENNKLFHRDDDPERNWIPSPVHFHDRREDG